MKISETTLLPLAEYPNIARALRRAGRSRSRLGIHRAAGPAAIAFAVLARPRIPSSCSTSRNEPQAAAERFWKRLEERPDRPFPCPPEANFYTWPELRETLEGNAELALRELELLTNNQQPTTNNDGATTSRPSLAFHGNIQAAVAEARNLVEQGYRVVFFGRSSGELERLADIFQEYSVPFQLGLDPADATRPYLAERSYVAGASASTFLVKGLIRRGVVFPAARIAVFGSEDLFDSSDLVAKPGPTKSQLAAFTADMADLKPGDYVVHEAHGIGRFLGTREIAQGDNKGDFMLLEYAGDAKLYVPLARLDLIQKYRGAGEGAAPGARPVGRRDMGTHENARQSQDARHGRRAFEALRAAPHGRRLLLFARQQLAARV